MASKVDLPSHFRDWNKSSDPSVEAPEKSTTTKPLWKRPWIIGITVVVAVVVIVAIAVPLAVILPKKGKGNHDTTVMLPLYLYPKTNATWSPLYDTLLARPDLDFTVIINPSSGPGSTNSPDEQYSAALKQLTAYANVRKIGYVRTGYASRNLTDIISELHIYAGWAAKDKAFAMDGIFFDESPHQYSSEAVNFMLSASRAVKDATGFQGLKTVVRNPGVIPDARFGDVNTDITVVFEESYTEYSAKEAELSTLKDDRSHHCYMVNSVPVMDKEKLRGFADDLSKRAKYLFLTTNSEHYYESFGDDWTSFATVVS